MDFSPWKVARTRERSAHSPSHHYPKSLWAITMVGIPIQLPALTIADYARRAAKSARFGSDKASLQKVRYGYFGEIGGLLAALKKVQRDELFEPETEFAAEELGDAVWYLFAVAHIGGVAPAELGEACLLDLRKRFSEVAKASLGEITFRHIDGIVATQGRDHRPKQEQLLGDLAETAGILAQDDRKQRKLQEDHKLADQLGHLLALLAITVDSFDLKLEDVARSNLVKINGRWPGDEWIYHPFFDGSPKYPDYEQFEREFSVKFEERIGNGKPHVVQSINGVFVGDRLTDNSVEPDGYRFHDVFHLAYVAHLGWSPVIRGLLKRKRKSDPNVDENQDGARAMIIEEGIATWIFNHAKVRKFYAGVEEGKLDYGLLKQIHSMVQGYEVDACPLWQWERAILEGFRVFREMKDAGGGLVRVDMNKRTIAFETLSKEA